MKNTLFFLLSIAAAAFIMNSCGGKAIQEEPDDPAADIVGTFDYGKMAELGHPRLMMTAQDFKDLKVRLTKKAKDNPVLVEAHEMVMGLADQYLAQEEEVVYKLDASGNKTDESPVSKLEFTGSSDILVASEEPIISWTINGVRIQPTEPVTEFKLVSVSSNVSMDIKIKQASAADAQVDESNMCHVVCEGCTFTYLPYKLMSVTEGDVPAGAPIRISANTSEGADAGYTINGGEPEGEGSANYQFTVTEDVKIVSK